jgi:phosphoribosylformimino-5-aminoimidazole carboxamide ribotide isomerase
MIVIPAIDLRDGACVQLVGGSYEDERVRLADPLAVALSWKARGFRRLHVIDLDAATGRGGNAAAIARILAEPGLDVQAGGGVRDDAAVGELLAAGASRVVVGTRAVEDPPWIARIAAAFPGRLIVAADVRGRSVLAGGWQRDTRLDVWEALRALAPLPLAGVLVTVVHREGRLEGTDLELIAELAGATSLPLHVAGGITRPDELAELDRMGIHAAVIGMALYTGALDSDLLQEFMT